MDKDFPDKEVVQAITIKHSTKTSCNHLRVDGSATP